MGQDHSEVHAHSSRFVAGVSIGIASTVNPLYVSENAPRGIRGLLTGLYQLTLVTGLTASFIHRTASSMNVLTMNRSLPFGSTTHAHSR